MVSRLGVPTPARFDGEFRKGLQACEAKPSKVEPTSQWPTAASWRRSFQTLGSNQGKPEAPGDKRQLLWDQSSSSEVPPFVRPIASEYPPTMGSHRVPQWNRGDDSDKIEPERPKGKIVSAP